MKVIGALRIAAALLALCLAALLAGCAAQIAPIEPNSVEQIEVESLPQSETWARVYTDRDKIGEVVSYLNGLRLRQLFSEDPDEYAGQSLVLTLTLADGTTREFTHFGNLFLMERGGAWQRMEYEQAVRLDGLLRRLPTDAQPEA